LLGKTGVALSDLKPNGEVRVQGEIWRAQSTSGNIQKGEQVTVKALEGLVVIVEKAPEKQQKAKLTP
jgi:membrane-bound serine protease (ClpP class)